MDLNKDYLQDLFIDEVKGCLGSDGGGGGGDISSIYDKDGDGVIDNAAQLGGVDADQYTLKTDIESSIANDEEASEVIDSVFDSSSVATEEEVNDVIDSVFN